MHDELYLFFGKELQGSKVSIYFLYKTMETSFQLGANLGFAMKVYACLTLDWQARKSRCFFLPP